MLSYAIRRQKTSKITNLEVIIEFALRLKSTSSNFAPRTGTVDR